MERGIGGSFPKCTTESRGLSCIFVRELANLATRKQVGGESRPTERANTASGGDLSLQDLGPNKGQWEGRERAEGGRELNAPWTVRLAEEENTRRWTDPEQREHENQ